MQSVKEQAIQFKLMKSNKEAVTIVANMAQMILQSRISPRPQQLQRIETVRSQIEVLRSHLNPSDQVLFFLIDKEHYQIKNKILSQQRKRREESLIIHICLTIFDKETSITETAQFWKIQLNRKQVISVTASHCVKELINLIREITAQLTSSYNFSEIIRNKEANKKYVIDFKVTVEGKAEAKERTFEKDYNMKNCKARLNENYQVEIGWYWRESNHFIVSPYATMHHNKNRKISQQTRVDSCSIGSLKDANVRKYRSIDQQQSAFQIYDTELDVTIISSDSDSLSHSRKVIQEITVGEVDEFELLIEEDTNDDEMFIIENQANFENWQKYLLLNFH